MPGAWAPGRRAATSHPRKIESHAFSRRHPLATATALVVDVVALPVNRRRRWARPRSPRLDQRLVGQSKLFVGFTAHFKVDAESYNRLAAAARGLYPTWEGVLLQLFAFVFVIGSYVAAEAVR